MTTVVFSDVHLPAARGGEGRIREFAAFLRSLEGAERVVCLGDLFDFWFEYRSVIFSAYFEVLRAFAELRDRGVELHFVRGNHDFWAGRFLEDALGFAIHDEVVLEQDGVRALLVHGDGLDPADRGYRVYKRVARAGLVVWLFRQLHPDWAMGLARAVSAGSRRANAPEHASLGSQVAPLRRFALERLAGEDVDAVLCGHSHYPAREEAAGGVYVNTGDWLEHRSYVVWSGGEFALKRFEAGPSV